MNVLSFSCSWKTVAIGPLAILAGTAYGRGKQGLGGFLCGGEIRDY